MADINKIKVGNEIYDVRDNHGLYEKMITWDGNVSENMKYVESNGCLLSGNAIPGVFYRVSDYLEMNNDQYLVGISPELVFPAMFNPTNMASFETRLMARAGMAPFDIIDSALNMQENSEFGKLCFSMFSGSVDPADQETLLNFAANGTQIGLNLVYSLPLYINTPVSVTFSGKLARGFLSREDEVTFDRGLWLFKATSSFQLDEVDLPLKICPETLFLVSQERTKVIDIGFKMWNTLISFMNQEGTNE